MPTNYDFLSIYYPADSELDQVRMQEMRDALSILTRSVYPTVDTAANTPFGDLFISPGAPALAGHEEAGNRLLSDLDPENVAAGTAWNCGFIRQFYLNLGIHDESSQRSYGIIRLAFSDISPREIDRSTSFRIGDGIYRPFVPQAGPVFLLPPGAEGDAGTNWRNYAFYSATSWVVDLLVMGNAGQLADAGSGVQLDRTIEGLVSAVALSDFMGGTTPVQLQELARRTRNNFFSRTPSTRGGATNLIHQQFPEITLTGCTVSGDFEMVRDVAHPLQVAAGCLDLMVRSAELLTDTATVRLRQMAGPGGSLVYAGWLTLPETAIKILSVTNGLSVLTPDLYSVSTDPEAPGLSAAYGSSERIWMSITETVPYGEPLVRAELDAEGVYADFTVTYLFDPALKICQEFLLADENVPAGLSLYCRWFVPIDIAALEISFNRRAGTVLNLEAAREDVLLAYNSSRFELPAGAAAIDAAFYYAGAHSVNSVDILAHVRYSIAGKVWLGEPDTFEAPSDTTSWEAFLADTEDVPVIHVTSVYMPQFTYADTGGVSGGLSTFAVSGERNVSYLLAPANLKLVELRSV